MGVLGIMNGKNVLTMPLSFPSFLFVSDKGKGKKRIEGEVRAEVCEAWKKMTVLVDIVARS